MSIFNNENGHSWFYSSRIGSILCVLILCLSWTLRTHAAEQSATTPPKLDVTLSSEVKTVESQSPVINISITGGQKPTVSGCPVLSESSEVTSTSLFFSVVPDPSGAQHKWRARSEPKTVANISSGLASNQPILPHGTYKCSLTISVGQDLLTRDVKISIRADRRLPIFLLIIGELAAIAVFIYRSSVPRAEVEKRLMHLSKDLHKTQHISVWFNNAIEKKIELAEIKIQLEKLSSASQLIHEGEIILEKWQHESEKWKIACSTLEAPYSVLSVKKKQHPLAGSLCLLIATKLNEAHQSSSAADFNNSNAALCELIEKCNTLFAMYDKMLNMATKRSSNPKYGPLNAEFKAIKERYLAPTSEAFHVQVTDRAIELDNFIKKLELIPEKPSMAGESGTNAIEGTPYVAVTPIGPRKHSIRTIIHSYFAPLAWLAFSHAVVVGMSYYKFYEQNLTFGSFEDYLYLSICPLFIAVFGVDASKFPNNLRDALRSVGNFPGITPPSDQ